jgi:hypothetical protein
MPVFSFDPKEAIDLGFVEGDYRVVAAYIAHQSWAKKDGTYKNPASPTPDSTVAFIELKNLAGDANAEPHRELYIIGGTDTFIPSNDGATPLPQSPRKTSQDVIPVAERASSMIEGPRLSRSSAFNIFLTELSMTGFPMEKIFAEGLKCLVGVEGHMRPEGKQKDPGAIATPKKAGERDERLTPVFKKILRLPWDGSAPTPAPAAPAAGHTNAAPAAPSAPATATTAPADKAVMKSATKHLIAVLSEDATAADTAIEDKIDLKKLLTKRLMAKEVEAAERNAIFALVTQPGFFNEVASATDEIGAAYKMKDDGDIKRSK